MDWRSTFRPLPLPRFLRGRQHEDAITGRSDSCFLWLPVIYLFFRLLLFRFKVWRLGNMFAFSAPGGMLGECCRHSSENERPASNKLNRGQLWATRMWVSKRTLQYG